jgi:hypothetical protein
MYWRRRGASVTTSAVTGVRRRGLDFRSDGDGSPGAVVARSESDRLKSSAVPGVPIAMTLVNRSGSYLRL